MKKIAQKCANRRRRILIAENSARTRKNLQDIFAVLPRLEFVGETKNGLETLQAVHVLKPDVLTLDIQMPGFRGIDVLHGDNRDLMLRGNRGATFTLELVCQQQHSH